MAGPMNPYDVPPPERRGMSGGTKVLLGVGIGCGLVMLLCCGVVGLGSFAIVKIAQSSTTKDARQIKDITEDIVAIAIPDALAPFLGLNLNLPVIGPMMKGAIFADPAQQNHLILGEVNRSFSDTKNLEAELRNSLQQHEREDIDVRESETIETTIHDEPARFTVSRGVGRESKTEYWEVVGHFQGSGGLALLLVKVETSRFTKEQVLDIIKSMK